MYARRKFLKSGVGLAVLSGASQLGDGVAQTEAPGGFRPTGSPWPLRTSEAFDYRSKAVGDTMAIGVWPSPGEYRDGPDGKSQTLDLVYVLDGSWALGMAATICRLQHVDTINRGFRPVLLVGVDYPEGRPSARSRDYVMADAVPERTKAYLSASPLTTPGGADNFLAFLEEELDPFIRSRYPVADRPAGIFGDSFGGTFTFYAFLKQSKLFDRYWLGSPGIHTTGTDYVAQFEARLKDRLVHPTKMFLSMGSLEIDGGDKNYEDMGRNYNRMVQALNEAPNERLTWASKVYEGYTHTSVLAPALNDALLYHYGTSAR